MVNSQFACSPTFYPRTGVLVKGQSFTFVNGITWALLGITPLGVAGFRGKEGIMQRIAILLVMAVIVAGCAAPSVAVVEAPSPYPTYTSYPTLAPLATHTPYPTYTAAPTYTAWPTQTSIPTATSLPTPAVTVPDDWATYHHPTGLFALRHPPTYEVVNENATGVTLISPRSTGTIIGVVDKPYPWEMGDETSLNSQTKEVLESIGRLDTVKVLEKGAWTEPVQANYVSVAVQDYVYDSWSWHIYADRVLSTSSYAMSTLNRYNGPITESDITEFQMVLATIHQ